MDRILIFIWFLCAKATWESKVLFLRWMGLMLITYKVFILSYPCSNIEFYIQTDSSREIGTRHELPLRTVTIIIYTADANFNLKTFRCHNAEHKNSMGEKHSIPPHQYCVMYRLKQGQPPWQFPLHPCGYPSQPTIQESTIMDNLLQ